MESHILLLKKCCPFRGFTRNCLMHCTVQGEIFEKKKKKKKSELIRWSFRCCLYNGQIIRWQRFHQSVALTEDFWAEDVYICISMGYYIWREEPDKTIPLYLRSRKMGQFSAAILWRISCLVVQKLPKAGCRSQKVRCCHWPKQTNKDPQQKITLPKIKIVLKDQQKQKWTRF